MFLRWILNILFCLVVIFVNNKLCLLFKLGLYILNWCFVYFIVMGEKLVGSCCFDSDNNNLLFGVLGKLNCCVKWLFYIF